MKKKQRTTGDVMLDMEKHILELVDQGLQWGDILNLVHGYLQVHCPGARETYIKGGYPEFYYGPKRK